MNQVIFSFRTHVVNPETSFPNHDAETPKWPRGMAGCCRRVVGALQNDAAWRHEIAQLLCRHAEIPSGNLTIAIENGHL
jgi:hypothetical protein